MQGGIFGEDSHLFYLQIAPSSSQVLLVINKA